MTTKATYIFDNKITQVFYNFTKKKVKNKKKKKNLT